MNLAEAATVAAITVSAAGLSYAALDVAGLTERVRATSDTATCRALDQAVVGYTARTGTAPTSVAALRDWVDGDVTGYRLAGGRVTGPGCARR